MSHCLRFLPLIASAAILYSCAPNPPADAPLRHADVYPDYRGVTIPRTIAPLNFMLTSDSVDAVSVSITDGTHTLADSWSGAKAVFDADEWRKLLSHSQSDGRFSVSLIYRQGGVFFRDTFSILVSSDAFDPYVTYRLIEPGYEVWNAIQIEERDMTSFETRILADNSSLGGKCMNCHIHGQQGQTTLFHLRGEGGGTMLARGGSLGKVKLAGCRGAGAVYGDISSSGRYGVFSTNVIIPALHSEGSRRLEVFDTESDLCLADFDSCKMILSPVVSRPDVFETFPCLSPDERKVYFCAAPAMPMPDSINSLRYSILSVGFDGDSWGSEVDTLWNADLDGGSASFPKVSPDGRFLLFASSRSGTFPIWRRETDLRMIDLASGREVDMSPLNSGLSETWHSWSSSGRWVVFASKRVDGQYGRVFVAHISPHGHASRPFVIPQADPESDILCLKSYNIPDVSPRPAPFSRHDVERVAAQKNVAIFAPR